MAIEITCDQCGKVLRAKESAAGKKAKCPACGNVVQLPMPKSGKVNSDEDDGAGIGNLPDEYSMPEQKLPDEPKRRPCPMCGEMIVATASKCRFCGESLDGSSPKKKSRGSLSDDELTGVDWFLIVFCGGIACIIGIIRMIQGKGSGGKMVAYAILSGFLWTIIRVAIVAALQAVPR